MKALKLAVLAAAGALALGSAARAQEDSGPVSLSFNVGASTDYVFRGVSQTNEDPQVFGGVDATLGEIGYAGVWASNVDFGNGTDAEVDVYGGIRPNAGPFALDIGVIYYGYVGAPDGPDLPYWEGKLAASVPAGPATLGAAIYYSPEFTGETGDATYLEANAASSIPGTRFSVSGAVGRQWIESGVDYTTWNLGVGFAMTDHLGFDLRYWDTDESDTLGQIAEGRVVLSMKAAF